MITGAETAATGLIDLGAEPGTRSPGGHQVLFDGYLNHPTQAAAALLLLGRVARHRFYLPPGMIAAQIASDPVVTTSHDRLRFESFSACCGMALRYDVLPDGLDGSLLRHGTTNIDLTGPTRIALTSVQGLNPLHIRITDDTLEAVTFTTLDHTATEGKAVLPQRWIRGFAEAQAVGATLSLRAQLSVGEARAFWRTLPRTGNGASSLYAAPTSRGLHLTGTPTPSSIPVGGPSRLRMIEPLLRHATTVTVYGPQDGARPGASLWQLNLPDGTLNCALSPTSSRGFSGEGGLLHQLADPAAADHADHISDHISDTAAGHPLQLADLAERLDLTPNQVASGLTYLAASGALGYDNSNESYFHRTLPWTIADTTRANPRLAAAQKLIQNGSITFDAARDTADVRHGTSHHRVQGQGTSATCTCPWIARHGTSRGPCKHVLAVNLVREADDR